MPPSSEMQVQQHQDHSFLAAQPASEDAPLPDDLSWNDMVVSERTAAAAAAAKSGTKSGLMGASFNFINSIIGAGIIGLAFALKECGFFVGLLLLVTVALLTDYTVRLLISLGHETTKTSYEALAQHCLGSAGFYIVSIMMGLMAFGAMCAYFVVIGDTVPPVFESALGPDHVMANRSFVICLFGLVFILPLCLLKDMSSLSWSSMLSIVAVCIIVLIVTGRAPEVSDKMGITAADDPQGLNVLSSNIFAGLGAISFAYVCHHSAFIVNQSLHNPTKERWRTVSRVSVASALFASVVLAVSGYAAFYSKTKGDVLNNFDADDGIINVARILLAFTMVFTFPMEQFVARHAMHAAIFRGKGPVTNPRHYSITLFLFGAALIIGLASEDLGLLLELTGGFCASSLGYVMPVVLYFCVHPYSVSYKKAMEEKTTLSRWCSLWSRLGVPLVVLAFGLTAMLAGTFNTIASAIEGE